MDNAVKVAVVLAELAIFSWIAVVCLAVLL